MKQKKFLIIDLLIFTIISIVSEWLGFEINGGKLFYISFLPIFTILMLIRWKYYGLIALGLCALSRPIIWGAVGFNEYMYYIIPTLFLAITLLFVRKNVMELLNKRKTIAMALFSLIYIIFVLSIGISGKIFISSDMSIMGELPKYLLMFVIGNVLFFLFSSQRTMLVNLSGINKQKTQRKVK